MACTEPLAPGFGRHRVAEVLRVAGVGAKATEPVFALQAGGRVDQRQAESGGAEQRDGPHERVAGELACAALGVQVQVTATAGGDSVAAIPLSRQRVESVGMVDGTLRMRTSGGQTVAYDQVLAFL